ncbi:MAG TPA: hypothetical protein VLM40_06680, partial [Gemmata sp.]|nr:hypothetical protein [Gemmata sp.]
GFIEVKGFGGKSGHTARPFTITWPAVGANPNQVPNTPMITRMDRGPGVALAIRGEAPFVLTPSAKELKSKPGGKLDITLKISRDAKFKDGIQILSAVPGFGPRQQGNNPPQPIATITADKKEIKLSVDVQPNTPPGTYSLVLQGRSAVPPTKGPNARPIPAYPAVPITVVIEGKAKKK